MSSPTKSTAADSDNRIPSTDITGRLYGRPPAKADDALVRCGPGTPGGELLRRYWQPLALSSEATVLPTLVKIFDEELILFRDGSGTPGLLYPRCMHRGTSLLYGKVEEDGIRCCYHGWKFNAEGHCIDMACEPGVQAPENTRQPWYPLVERHGIIFTYMGPPEKQPLFPRFSICENLGDNEKVVARGGLDPNPFPNSPIKFGTDYNWWNFHDNVIDPFHLYWLHSHVNGVQFVDSWKILPKVTYEHTRDGVRSIQYRDTGDGHVHLRLGQSFMPNIMGIGAVNDLPGQSGIGWTIAIDDTHFRTFSLSRVNNNADPMAGFKNIGVAKKEWGPGKPTSEWTLEDQQHWQSDYECQKGQGNVNLHSDEHLRPALDGGLAVIRRMFIEQTKIVAQGGDPIGVSYDAPYLYEVTSGIALLDKETMECIEGFDGRPIKSEPVV